jgi:hypothetical protein
MVEGIASALEIPPDEVVAAVFGLRHEAGNGIAIMVFRAEGLTSAQAIERIGLRTPTCGGSPESGTLDGHHTVVIRLRVIDQCQPRYFVELDTQTVAVITDDGAYAGNAAPTPTVPFRPPEEIEWIVIWLENALRSVELMPGGPPLIQG